MKSIFLTLVALLVMVSASHAQPAFEHRSLEEALNPDGTLKRGVQGSFKAEGYQMRTGANGEPIFLPQTQNTTTGTWDTQFGLPNGVARNNLVGHVYALAVDGQGNIYIGGSFTQAGGVVARSVARYNPQTNTWSALGTGAQNGVDVGSGGIGVVYALAIDGSGRVYVGGNFTQAGGVSANYVARFDPATNTWTTLGTGAQNGVSGSGFSTAVYALAIDGSGKVYVGGRFTQAGGVSANSVARFDPATNTWTTLGTGAQNGVSGNSSQVFALAIDGSGKVYVGGGFTQAGGVSANSVARFDPATNTWSALGTGTQNGVSGGVLALAIDGSGRVYVGGEFSQAGGVSAHRVAHFDPLANSWMALGTGSNNGVGGGSVNALAILGNEIYVGGTFALAGGLNGMSANHVAKFSSTTNSWSILGTSNSYGVSNGNVSALIAVGSDVYVGGNFTQAGEVSVNSLARYSSPTNTWHRVGDGNGVNNQVSALAVDGQGNVYVGGSFTQVGNIRANRIARFNTATNTWSVLGTESNNGVSGNLNNTYVRALAVLGSDLYVGGQFLSAGGVTANNIARFNLTTNTWSALTGNGVYGTGLAFVSALASIGNDLYVGGQFNNPGNNVVRYNTVTNTWSILGTGAQNGVNNEVRALAIDGSGRVYVGGWFTQAGGVSANRVARFDPATNSWSALGSGVDGDVNALVVDGQGNVYVGGSFSRAGGIDAFRVARFDPVTNTWSRLGTGNIYGVGVGVVSALAVFGSEVYVGGSFYTAGNVTMNQIARFNPATNTWSAVGTGGGNGVGGVTNPVVSVLAVIGNDLYIGGFFTEVNNGTSPIVSRYIARWTSGASRVEQISTNAPRTFLLEQNYPNPFNPTTVIGYQLPVASEVSLKVYDVLGREVMTLVNGRQEAGAYNFTLNATGLASGIYFYRLQAGNFVQTKKMMLVK